MWISIIDCQHIHFFPFSHLKFQVICSNGWKRVTHYRPRWWLGNSLKNTSFLSTSPSDIDLLIYFQLLIVSIEMKPEKNVYYSILNYYMEMMQMTTKIFRRLGTIRQIDFPKCITAARYRGRANGCSLR